MSLTDKLIEQRQSTHGNVEDNAFRLFWLNRLVAVDENDAVGDLSIRMLNLKLARFLSSGCTVKDSIDDALGYLQLGGDIKLKPRVVRLPVEFYFEKLGVSDESFEPMVVECRRIIRALHNHDLVEVKTLLTYIQARAEKFKLT